MGCCWSRRRSDSDERKPLLARRESQLEPASSALDKLVDAVGALEAGKLPSQDQLTRWLQLSLKSDILRQGNVFPTSGTLSAQGQRLLDDSRELVQAILQVGLEKNYDDIIQDSIFSAAQIQAPVRVDASAAVSVGEDLKSRVVSPNVDLTADAILLSQSVKSLLQLLVTSTAFRLLLSDFLTAARNILARVASEVGTIAQQVQTVAEDVENVAHIDGITAQGLKGKAAETLEDVKDIRNNADHAWTQTGAESAEDTKDLVISRLQAIITEAHSNPQYISALRTILFIFRRYANTLSGTLSAVSDTEIPNPTLLVEVDAGDLSAAFWSIKTALERAASNHSLDPALNSLAAAVTYALHPPAESQASLQLASYFAALSIFCDRALKQPNYIVSRQGTKTAESLYDSGRVLAESDSIWTSHISQLVNECTAFIHDLEHDKSTQRLVRAIDSLQIDTKSFLLQGVSAGLNAQQHWREEFLKDVLGWVLPRILKGIRTLPLARAEFQNPLVDVALDALFITSGGTSFMPDRVTVKSWNELTIDMVDSTQNDSSAKIHMRMDGIRLSASGVGYYFKYKGDIFGYEDQGLLNVHVGDGTPHSDTGLCLEIELETSTSDRHSSNHQFFSVNNVKATVPGLVFSIEDSKHWILNKLLVQPLSGPIVRRLVRKVLEDRITTSLEAVSRLLTDVTKNVKDTNTKDPSLGDYWSAFIQSAPFAFSHQESDEDEPSDVVVESHTTATLKGLVHTTVTQPDANNSDVVEETALAIGGGAQLFPNKAGPYEPVEQPLTVTEVARAAVDEVQTAVEEVVDSSKDAVDTAVEMRADIEHAEERREERQKLERKRRGWRSRAFD